MQHLNSLLDNLDSVKRDQFFTNGEISTLFGNIQDIVQFQQQFLQSLEEALQSDPSFLQLEHPNYFKVCSRNAFTSLPIARVVFSISLTLYRRNLAAKHRGPPCVEMKASVSIVGFPPIGRLSNQSVPVLISIRAYYMSQR